MNANLRNYHAANRALLAFTLSAVLFCLAILSLGRVWPGHFTLCASMRLFGAPCPLCGVTRGLVALARGNPVQAAAYNALTIPIAILLVIEVVYRITGSFVRLPDGLITRLTRADAAVHATGLIVYLIWAAVFYIRLLSHGHPL